MRSRAIKAAILATTIALTGSIGLGQTSSNPIDRVEEDWVLVIGTPDSTAVGPQITTCMSPVSDGSTPFVAFDLNYQDYPSFLAGGLQAKVYSNSSGDVLSSSSQGDAVLQTTGETITWTQRMSLSGSNTLTYTIVNGQSTTWGAFGQAQGLNALSFTAAVSSLANYSPATSVAKSGVGWQSNRITSMTLVQVRYYSDGQLVATDTTSRSVNLSIGGSS
jgi:hypothetical protein